MIRLTAGSVLMLLLVGPALAQSVGPESPVVKQVQTPAPPPPLIRISQIPVPSRTGRNLPAVPISNPARWVGTVDYPTKALREEREGTTAFKVTVGPQGRVTACAIMASSGSSDLDEATCRLVTQRAVFHPALDRKGKPTTGAYQNRVRWALPKPVEVKPGHRKMVHFVETDGSASGCEEWVDGKPADPQSSRSPCKANAKFKPFLDVNGQPVRKRVTITIDVAVSDVP